MSDPNSGPGWYEWHKMPANTTEISYVHENGEVFDPSAGWNSPDFLLAAAEGRVHRLERSDQMRGCSCMWDCRHEWCGCTAHQPSEPE